MGKWYYKKGLKNKSLKIIHLKFFSKIQLCCPLF